MCCLCLLVGVVLLVAQPPLLYAYAYNATHAPAQPAPAELHRLLESAKWEDTPGMGGIQTPDGAVSASYLHDLLVTVRYLAKRALESR